MSRSLYLQQIQRRRFLQSAAAFGGVSTLLGPGALSTAYAAPIQLTSVAAMVAEAEVAWEQELADKWNAAHPEAQWAPERVGWESIFEKVLAYEMAGSPANLGYGWTGFTADWHQMDIIDAPEDHLGQQWKDRFARHLTTSGGDVIDGKLWVVPVQAAAEGMVVRKDWLEEAGVEPTSIRNWDNLVDSVAKVAKLKSNQPFAIPLGNARNAGEKTDWFFSGNGLQHLADFDPSKRDNYIEVLETLRRLRPYIPENALSMDYVGHRQAFATGIAGFITIGDYYFGEIYPTAKDLMKSEHVAMLPFPGGSKGDGVFCQFNMNCYYMMANAPNQEKTAELIDFITQPESLLRWSLGHPPLKEWTVDEAVANRLYGEAERWWLEQVKEIISTVHMRATEGYVAKNEVQQVYYEHLLKVFDDSLTPAQAYDSMQAAIPKLILDAKGG